MLTNRVLTGVMLSIPEHNHVAVISAGELPTTAVQSAGIQLETLIPGNNS